MFRSIATAAVRRVPTQNLLASSISKSSSSFNTIRFTGLRSFSSEDGGDGPKEVMKGVVKWFDAKKGFGFIIPNDGSNDVFVHHSAIHSQGFRSLADGEDVEFNVVDSDGRRNAVDVTGPEGSYVQGRPFRPRYEDDNDGY